MYLVTVMKEKFLENGTPAVPQPVQVEVSEAEALELTARWAAELEGHERSFAEVEKKSSQLDKDCLKLGEQIAAAKEAGLPSVKSLTEKMKALWREREKPLHDFKLKRVKLQGQLEMLVGPLIGEKVNEWNLKVPGFSSNLKFEQKEVRKFVSKTEVVAATNSRVIREAGEHVRLSARELSKMKYRGLREILDFISKSESEFLGFDFSRMEEEVFSRPEWENLQRRGQEVIHLDKGVFLGDRIVSIEQNKQKKEAMVNYLTGVGPFPVPGVKK